MDPRKWSWEIYYSAVLLVLGMITLFLHTCKSRSKKLNLPPGPKPWPIVGNLLQMGTHPHRTLQDLSQKYGPIMHLRFGSVPVVVASSDGMAKKFLQDHDLDFANRPRQAAGKLTGYNWTNMTWSFYGPYWRQARRIYAAELLSASRIAAYEPIRADERKSLIRRLYASAGKPVNLRDHLFTASLHVIFRILFGKSVSECLTSTQEMRSSIQELFVLAGALNIGDRIPWLAAFDLQGYTKRMNALNTKLDALFEREIDIHNERRRLEGKDWVAKDAVDVFLQLSDDSKLEVKLQRQNIKGFISEFITGSTDTTTLTLEWTMSELLKNPEHFNDATKELDFLIGKEKWVEENDIPQLTHIQAIVKEGMRMHPIIPLLPHATRDDCTVDGYDILGKTEALINVWAIGRDPSSWKSPSEFKPKRFISNTIDVKGKNFELLPFGAGRRICPGLNLGLKVVQITIANLLHGFDWKLAHGLKPNDLDMEEVFGLILSRKKPLEVIVTPRLPHHLYA